MIFLWESTQYVKHPNPNLQPTVYFDFNLPVQKHIYDVTYLINAQVGDYCALQSVACFEVLKSPALMSSLDATNLKL